MRYPPFLREKGTIGFVAPAFGCAVEPYYSAFRHALEVFAAAGYRTQLGPNCFADRGIGVSNAPELCGKELHDLYLDENCEVLISCGGGELMCEVVPYIGFDAIAQSAPKWYMGYSDNTNFTFLSAILADTAAIYGPCAPAFGMEPWHPALWDAFQLLRGQKDRFHSYDFWELEKLRSDELPLLPYNVTEPVVIRSFPEGDVSFRGRLIGGCLDCLVTLLGTEFDAVEQFCERYAEDGMIWFLEACDLNLMSIRRALWQMKHAGWFSHVKGFLIGRPQCFGQKMFGIDQYGAVTAILEEYGVPIIMDLDIGHLPPMMPVVCGAIAEAELKRGCFQIRYIYE